MGPNDIEHPDTLTEALEIERVGGRPWVEAMGELVAVVDTLFDGKVAPHYVGASRRAQDAPVRAPATWSSANVCPPVLGIDR